MVLITGVAGGVALRSSNAAEGDDPYARVWQWNMVPPGAIVTGIGDTQHALKGSECSVVNA